MACTGTGHRGAAACTVFTWIITFLAVGALVAQDPAKDKDKDKGKPPPLPAINPGNAKLDITMAGLEGPGWDVAASADMIVAACESGSILVYKKDVIEAARKGAVKPEVLKAHQGPVIALAWNGGPILASAGADKKLIVWKMPEGKPVQTAMLETLPRALAMSPDGKTIASAGEDNTVQLWDAASAKPGAKLKDHADWINCLAWSADGKQLASGDLLGRVLVWDVPGAKKIADLPAKPNPPPKTPPEPVTAHALCFGADGKSVLVGDAKGLIQHISVGDGKVLRTFTGHTGPVTALALHPAGAVLFSASKDRTVKLWNAAAPQPASQAIKNLEGHAAWVQGLALVPPFTRAASVSADQTLRIWDFGEPAKK
jgi:WD40 repeat protein